MNDKDKEGVLNSFSIEDIEKRLTQDIKKLENIFSSFGEEEVLTEELQIEIEPVIEDKKISIVEETKKNLSRFIKSRDQRLAKDITTQIKVISSILDESSQFCAKLLEKLINTALKYQKVHSLLEYITENFETIFSEVSSIEKEEVINKIKEKYTVLKSRSQKTRRLKEQDVVNKVYQKLVGFLESKLQEINIKIEENQRVLQNIGTLLEKAPLKPKPEPEPEPEKTEEDEIFFEKEKVTEETISRFAVFSIGSEEFAIPDEFVMNTYRLSSGKAEKLAKRSMIKFGQLKGFFSSLTRGLKDELKNRENIKDLFLHVLQPVVSEEGLKSALVVKIPDADEFGVIFAQKVSLKEGNLVKGYVKFEDRSVPLLDLKTIWLKKQIESGIV